MGDAPMLIAGGYGIVGRLIAAELALIFLKVEFGGIAGLGREGHTGAANRFGRRPGPSQAVAGAVARACARPSQDRRQG